MDSMFERARSVGLRRKTPTLIHKQLLSRGVITSIYGMIRTREAAVGARIIRKLEQRTGWLLVFCHFVQRFQPAARHVGRGTSGEHEEDVF